MKKNKGKILLNTLFWGFILWLIGYILGLVFFAFVPKEQIGWYVMPLGIIITLWILAKKIKRDSFGCYIGLGVIWTIVAMLLDYIFIVKMFNSSDYYKLDVYVYYVVTFILPILFAIRKFNKHKI
ncbi:MAG: hypothetical protein WCV71_04295 [Patescibacteria group bacterium]